MITLASIIEQFAPQYLAQYGAGMLPSQRQALAAMQNCRSTLGPCMLARCDDCGQQRLVPHSCGHRSCPHCQHFESQRWIERQSALLVPASYFLITFTLPAQLRTLAWQHQHELYNALMDCAWQTVRTFSANHRQLHGSAGALAVLHTHSRDLNFHPHVHLMVPAATLDVDKKLWRTLRKSGKGEGYLFNHKALAKAFRGKFLATLRAQGLPIPAKIPDKWVVDCKSVGDGSKTLVYLGRYLYRGVIAEKDILRCEDGQVTYRWRNAKTNKPQQRTVSAVEFLRLVLQHVLPKGFRRSRNYGFLHPNSKRLIALLQPLRLKYRLSTCAPIQDTEANTPVLTERPKWICSCCGGFMSVVRRRIAAAIAPLPPALQELSASA